MKIAHLGNATRVSIIGKNGLAYEDYNLFKDGAEIHVQDDERTIKIFPASDAPVETCDDSPPKRTLVGRIGQMEVRNPWTWPLIALSILVVVVLIGTIAAILTGCAAGQTYGGGSRPAPAEPRQVQQGGGAGIAEHKVALSDGRTITCLTWSDHSLMTETTSSGMSCDWPVAEGSE